MNQNFSTNAQSSKNKPADAEGQNKGASKTPGAPLAGDRAAASLTKNVKQGAEEVAEGVKAVAGQVATDARRTAEAQIASGKNRAAGSLGGVANALRLTGETLRKDEQLPFLTGYVEQAADKVEEASIYLQDRSMKQIVRDVESFARREPALFIGGAFVLGMLGGRFLKSSRTGATGESSGSQMIRMDPPLREEREPVSQPVPNRQPPSGAV